MNKNNKIDILSIGIDPLTISEANSKIAKYIGSKNTKSVIVVKPYVEFLVTASQDSTVANMLNSADLCLADGVSLQWAASYLYGSSNKKLLAIPRSGAIWLQKPEWRSQVIPEKMAGATQTKDLLSMAEKHNWRVGIIGGMNKPEAIEQAVLLRFPKLNYLSTWSGFYSSEAEKEIVLSIQEKKLDLLFVAMGFPRQEEFMFRNKLNNLATVMIGEGGTFDYEQMGGPIRRAPNWMQKTGTEWLWRLVRQPTRLKRQSAIPKFILLVKKQKKHSDK